MTAHLHANNLNVNNARITNGVVDIIPIRYDKVHSKVVKKKVIYDYSAGFQRKNDS